ncbi:MAG: nucleotidyltransferase domain-containing protein [Candidatus Aenigmarchaeota archaeon]|nr:nucleotidyltransferase domain-containing protein [Candidatus Aenigmarchaeota archaeon]
MVKKTRPTGKQRKSFTAEPGMEAQRMGEPEDVDRIQHMENAEMVEPVSEQPDEYGKPKKPLTKQEMEKEKQRKERIEILKKFTKDVLKLYGPVVRSIVLFGSTARDEFRGESDIDVFLIIDDTRNRITPAFRDKLEDDLDIIAKKCSKQLSVQQPYLLTEFWQMVRIGHPIVFNFIREGVPVYDRDIFLPIKRLLQMGEIKPSREAVEKYIERGPKRVKRVENAKIYMVVEDLYYAMLESAQAVLMFLGKNPPRPGDAPEALRRTLVKMSFLDEKSVKDLEDIIELRKEVEHKRVNKVDGKDLDEWIVKSKAFVKRMQGLIVKIEILKRENIIEKSYSIMTETTLTLLKALNKPSPRNEPLSKAFEASLVRPGLVDKKYLDVLTDLERMNKVVKDGKVLELQKGQLLMNREYVRKFIREAGRILKKKLNVHMDSGDNGE